MLEKDCKLLRVSRDADLEEIRQAFVKLTRRYPPEHFPEKFKKIKGAYDRLTLNWDSIKPMVKDLAYRDTPEGLKQLVIQEVLQAESSSSSASLPELDIQPLEPILNIAAHRQDIREVLEEVHAQGLEYMQL
ncbi:MAG: J domain-containing protein [Desulfohalobiaceae bacterium]